MSMPVDVSKPNERRGESSALHALVSIAQRLGIEVSHAELRRNYALPDKEPPNRLLLAIARDLGIDARVIKVSFKDLPRLGNSLPAIIRVRSGAALILESAHVDPNVGPVALLKDPTVQDAKSTPVDKTKLSSIWDGEVILLKRRFAAADEQQPFGMSWLVGQVLRERRLFIDISLGAIVSTIFALAPPLVFMIVINRVLTNHSFSTLYVLGGAILIMMVFETILGHLRRLLVDVVTTRIDGRLNLYLVERMLRLPMDYFERNATGRIMSKIGRMWQIRNFITGQLFGAFLDAIPLIGLIPIMFILDWRLALLAITFAGLSFLIVMAFITPIGRRFSKVIHAEQKRGAHLTETIYGMRTIKALALEGRRRREWDARVAETTDARYALGRIASYPQTFTLPFERLIYSGTFLIGSYMVLTMPTELNAGSLVAFAMLSMRMGQPLMQIARLQLDLAEARGSVSELASILNIPPEQANESAGLRHPVEGEFTFKDVRFRYSPDAAYALDGVSFSIPRGKMLGVMGRSGSGKTTLTRLLQRLHANYDGLIKVDGMDLREINLAHLRTNIGVVLQENFLFSGTIRDNISMARPDATMSQIIRAAQLAGAEEFIERMPRGYETHLEEGAANLSGGQRQRLAIARALLTDPPVLILDEATSALDAESEAIVNANLRRIAQGRTVISISHRLSMLVDADAIMVLERGKVYDMGTHEELLDRCDIYKQLWYQQNRHIERSSKAAPIAALGQS